MTRLCTRPGGWPASILRRGACAASALLMLPLTGCGPQPRGDMPPSAVTPAPAETQPVAQQRWLLPGVERAAVIAFVNVAVVPMDRERVVPAQTVIVSESRITQIGPVRTVHPPAGALIIDGTGRFLMPGLAEMHAHIPPSADAEQERTLFLFVANGVTTIRGMLGVPAHLGLRTAVQQGELLAPRVFTAGPSLSGSSASAPAAALRIIESQAGAGFDFLKVHPGLSQEVFDTVVSAARRHRIPFAGHVSADVGLNRALESGQATIDHLDGYVEAMAGYGGGFAPTAAGWFGLRLTDAIDSAKIQSLAAATRAAGVWNVPTLSLMERVLVPIDPEEMARAPEMRYVAPETLQEWIAYKRNRMRDPAATAERVERYLDTRRRLVAALQSEGAGLLLGSDAPQFWNVPGFSIHHELAYLVAAGLTPYEALATGTRLPAEFFGTREWGTISEGTVADLILLDANPLEDIGNVQRIAGIMLRGSWLPESAIGARLDAIAASLRPSR